jgi:protease YdgD
MRLAALVLTLAVLPLTLAAQSSGLTRLTDREDLLGWEAVGRLDLGGRGFCTGTLIAADLVLTAAHCLVDRRSGAAYDPASLTFRAGLRDGAAIAERQGLQVAIMPGYDRANGMHWDNVRRDVALLRLAKPITVREANPFVLHQGSANGARVSVVSYGEGRMKALSRQRECQLMGAQNGLMAFDCDVTFGSSGAPVFAHTGQRGRILSIVSGGGRFGGRDAAFGMELPGAVARLKAQLRAAPAPRRAYEPIRRVKVGRGTSKIGTGAKFIGAGG